MQGKTNELTSSSTSYGRAFGNFLLGCLGALFGFVYHPLTMPFIYAGSNMRLLQKRNKTYWNKFKPNSNSPSPLNYVAASFIVAGSSILQFFVLIMKFPLHIFYSMWTGLRDGFRYGPLKALTKPSHSFNRYQTNGEAVPGTVQFRSTHILILGLIITLIFCAVMTTLLIFFPYLLAPLTILTKLTGLNLASLLGIKTTAFALPFLNFTALLILTLPCVYALKAAVFALVTVGKEVGEFMQGLINPRSQGFIGKRLQFALTRFFSFVEKIIAVAVGIPLYLVFKPYYLVLDRLRSIYSSGKNIWRSGIAQSKKTSNFFFEWVYKVGVVIAIFFNTIIRSVLLPFQLIASILYAPLQSTRHAVKYGLTYVLAYPHKFANNYRGQLYDKETEKEYKGEGRNYDNIKVKKYENVYYFKKRHIVALAILVGIALVLLGLIFPPLGYLSISFSVKLLTPLGLTQFALSGVAYLIINFVTGVLATTAVAITLKISSWLINKVSEGLGILKRFLSGKNHFHNLLHSSVSAGEAFRLMTRENLAVKTIASTVNRSNPNKASEDIEPTEKFGVSWVFNLDQLKDPAGVSIGKRPVYLEEDSNRSYDRRHKTYTRWNPRTGVIETREMKGQRGRPKTGRYALSIVTLGFIPTQTKKTNVSLAPKDGMMAYFGGRNDPIGLAFDMTQLNTKGDKYVFIDDAWTNLKWWWEWIMSEPAFKKRVRPSTSLDGVRSHTRAQRMSRQVPEHNDILTCLTKNSLTAVVISSKETAFRVNALFRKLIIKYELGIDLPILIMGTLNDHNNIQQAALSPKEYTIEEQLVDLFSIYNGTTKDPNSKRVYDAVAKHYANGRTEESQKKSFVRALVNSHPVNWATVFRKLDEERLDQHQFKDYIANAARIDLNCHVDYKPMPNHLVACSA